MGVGLCYILSMTNLRSEPGGWSRTFVAPTAQRGGQCPGIFFFGPYIRLGEPTYGFSVHGFGHDGFFFGPWYCMLQLSGIFVSCK